MTSRIQTRIGFISVCACLAMLALSGITAGADAKPLKVYIMAGQSNMQGHCRVRTF